MELAQHLYLKTGSKVRGPVSANVLHKMIKNKEVDSSAMFSLDGNKWISITKLVSSRPKKESEKFVISDGGGENKDATLKVSGSNAVAAEIPELLERVNKAAGLLSKVFDLGTYSVFALASVGVSMIISLGLRLTVPAFSPILHIAMAVVPSILAAGVIAHAFGNYFMKSATKLSKKEKYSLAVHVPWESAPAGWSDSLKKWLYYNDWLVENDSADILPYVRAFVTGSSPAGINEEVDLWQSIMQGSRKRFDANVGHSVRELACLKRLPAWTAEITPGMNLQEFETALGSAGRKWAVNLLKRAAGKRRDIAEAFESGGVESVIFEFFCRKLDNGRDCLMVILSTNKTGVRRTGRAGEHRAEDAA